MTPLRFRLLVGSLFVVSFVGALDHTIVSTSLATIAGELGTLEQMGAILIGYTLANAVLIPVIGRVGDLLGHRAVFLSSLGIFLLASLACGFAQDIPQITIARVAQGIGAAGLQLMSQTIVGDITSPRDRPKYLSLVGSAFPVAILVGPLLGGLITDAWGWPWVFWINLPIGIASFVLATFAMPRAPKVRTEPHFDIVGAVAFSIGMVGLVLGVTWSGEGASLAAVLAVFSAAIAAFAVFAVAGFRSRSPLLPLRMFADRSIAAATALAAIVGTGMFAVTSYLPTYFQLGYSVGATLSGVVAISTVFGMLVGNLVTGWAVSRTGSYKIFPIVGTFLGCAGMTTMSVLPVGLPLWVPTIVMTIVGVGTGAFMSLPVAIAQNAAGPAHTGSATAAINLATVIGSTITTAILGATIAGGISARIPEFSSTTPQDLLRLDDAARATVAEGYVDVFAPIFLSLAAVYAVGILAALALPARRLAQHHDSVTPEGATAS